MRSWLLLFACNLMWALQFTCIKLVQDQVGPMFTVWGPMTLSMLMLIPFVMREKAAPPKVPRGTIVRTYLLLAGAGCFSGAGHDDLGHAHFAGQQRRRDQPGAAGGNRAVRGDFPGRAHDRDPLDQLYGRHRGVLLCSGIDFGTLSFGGSYLAGNSLIFLATLGSAFYNSYGKKALEWHSPMRMLFWTYVAVCAMMAPVVLAEEGWVFARIPSFTARTWAGMALLTFFHNYLSMVLFLMALKNLDAIQAALSNYLITFFGVIVAAIWLGEKLTAAAIAGGLLVLGRTLLITVWEELRSRGRAAAVNLTE